MRRAFEAAVGGRRRAGNAVFELDGLVSNRAAGHAGVPNWSMRDALLLYALMLPATRVAMGHFRFVEQVHGRELERVHFVTLLRDPVERFVSLHLYRLHKDNAVLSTGRDLYDLLETRPELATRLGASYVEAFRGGRGPHRRPVEPGDVEAACRSLEQFSVVGCLEDMASFTESLQAVTGLEVEVERLNPSPAPASSRPGVVADDRLVEQIRDLCEPDRLVYERAWDLRRARLP